MYMSPLRYAETLKEEVGSWFGFPRSEEKMKLMRRDLARRIDGLRRQVNIVTCYQSALHDQLHAYALSLRSKDLHVHDEAKIRDLSRQIAQHERQKRALNHCLDNYIKIDSRLQAAELDHSSINALRELANITSSQYGNHDAVLKLEERLEKARLANEMISDTVLGEFSTGDDIDEIANEISSKIMSDYFLPKPPTRPITTEPVTQRIAVPVSNVVMGKGGKGGKGGPPALPPLPPILANTAVPAHPTPDAAQLEKDEECL
jgi:hypothetical protein